MNLETLKSTWNGWTTKKKAIVIVVALVIIGALTSKNDKNAGNPGDAPVAVAPAVAPEVIAANNWQREFFSTIKEYAKRTNLIDNPEIVKNRTRSEQEEYDQMVAKGKAMVAESKGKMLIDQKCWYLGRQSVADTELWCYESKYSPDFLFKVKISEADAKQIGQLFKDDGFIFSGTIGDIELEPISYNGGNVKKHPPTIMIVATSIQSIK